MKDKPKCNLRQVVLLRHGESVWNKENLFTGWTDVDLSDAEIVELNIPTGIPLVYELDEDLKPIRHYYLGDAERVQKAMQAVASQASLKD